MVEELPASPTGPVTLQDLQLARTRFAVVFAGAFVLSLITTGIFNALLPRIANLSPGAGFPLAVISVLILLLPGISIIFFAPGLGIKQWWLLIPISIWPIINWVAFALVVTYLPDHLRSEDSPSATPVWLWFLPGLLPCAAMALCTVISPDYMNQLYFGPPRGANIPGLGIPCGWPIMLGVCFTVGLANYSLWLGALRWRLKSMVVTGALVLFLLVFPALWIGLTGPAAVQVFQQYFVGP